MEKWQNRTFSQDPNQGVTTPEQSPLKSLSRERELAEYARDQITYAGFFVDPEEVYAKFLPSLSHRIRYPHITTAYHPGTKELFLDSLGSEAKIKVIAYGDDGKNQGLLVEAVADDPAIQKTLVERVAPDNTGEKKPVPIHITLSISDDAEAVNTRNLHFEPLEVPVELKGNYKLFRKDGTLISDKDTIINMQSAGFVSPEIDDPDRF